MGFGYFEGSAYRDGFDSEGDVEHYGLTLYTATRIIMFMCAVRFIGSDTYWVPGRYGVWLLSLHI